MRALFILLLIALLPLTACQPAETADEGEGEAAEAEGEEAEEAEAEGEEADEAEAEADEEEAAEEPADDEVAADTWENGVYTSAAFNVRFNLPDTWTLVEDEGDTGPAGLGTSDDSITFTGPEETGLRLVVANTDSIQLVDASFDNLTETIGFDNVRIVPDRTQTRTFNGIPGYRTEADALLRGDAVPVYIIAQALELPGEPTMFTLFVPGDQYHVHSEDMFAILDSVEALNLRD